MFRDVNSIGEKVWDVLLGWGEIVRVNPDPECAYPITVSFLHNTRYNKTYTRAGFNSTTHAHPSLYWDELVFAIPERPLPELPEDAKLLVYDEESETWQRAHFHSVNPDRSVNVWSYGHTSYTAEHEDAHYRAERWKYFK